MDYLGTINLASPQCSGILEQAGGRATAEFDVQKGLFTHLTGRGDQFGVRSYKGESKNQVGKPSM